MPQFEIIDAVDPSRPLSHALIDDALRCGEVALSHGDTFTGRPGTRIHASDRVVVKLRSELTFDEKDRYRWVQRTLERECELGVHHPAKTWFLLRTEDGGSVIANATPRLRPLHQMTTEALWPQLLAYVRQMLTLYVRIAADSDLRLDEGLSNFGVDADGRLFYLDDEVYRWDGFTSLAQALGVLFRQQEWMSAEDAAALGDALARAVWQCLDDPHYLRVIGEQLRGLFFAPGAQQARMKAFVDRLFAQFRTRPAAEGAVTVTPAARCSLPAPREDADALFASGRPVAILADVHANLPALQAVLAALAEDGVTDGIVLGDLVGYGPHPEACIDRIAQAGFHVIMGNHDYGLIQPGSRRGLSANARWVLDWSRGRVRPEQRDWIAALPPYLQAEGWLAVHGAPRDPSFFYGYVYRMTFEDNLDNLAERDVARCFHGHSHLQGVYTRGPAGDEFCNAAEVSLARVDQALICPGSIGQPRGGVPGAEYAVYDPSASTVSLRRVDYALAGVVDDMKRNGFPPMLIDRLYEGR
ncbi:MAG TPA: metallophosphatase family protein [Phycisphaerales bacterium]|nr:metallophosphatase family protein [Phycisphaerales bacterium]